MPRRANAPTTIASIGSHTTKPAAAPPLRYGNAPMNADSAPYHGPKSIAIGSVMMRPSRSAAIELSGRALMP